MIHADGCVFHWCPSCAQRVSQTHECPHDPDVEER